MADLESLLTLQSHDLALDRLRHRRATLPERAAVTAAEAEVARLRAQAATLQGPCQEIAREIARLEDEAQSLADHADVAERKLYSGTVTSPRELQALQADVDQLRRHQRSVEERALEAMERREPLAAELRQTEAALAEQEGVLAAARDALTAAEAVIDQEITDEQTRRDEAAAAVDDALLALYTRCRERAPSGVGAARLVGFTCQGCHLTVPATEVDRIRKAPPGTIAHCDNCGAILVP